MGTDDFLFSNDEIFSISARFSIMLLLYTHKSIGFADLFKLLKMTAGNLNHHLTKLSEAKYITTRKMLFPKRPLVIVEITKFGKEAFSNYLSKLHDMLKQLNMDT